MQHTVKKSVRPLLAVAGVVTIAAASFAATPQASAAGKSYHGCPRGAVCFYPQNKGFNHDHPDSNMIFFSYAGHNIYNQYGLHVMVDNQYGAHYEGLCAKSGGSGGFAKFDGVHDVGFGATAAASATGSAYTVNLTPVNSVDLRPDSQRNSTCHR